MSNEWKIAQELKRINQNNSFGSNGYKETGEKREYNRKLTNKELRDKKWKEFESDFYFSEEDKEENIKELKSYITECKDKDEPIIMRIGKMNIVIDEKDPSKVSFLSNGNINHSNSEVNQYPYRVTINGKEIYSEIDVIDENLRATYKENGKMDTRVKVSRTVTIVNGEEINEFFSIKGKDIDKDEIVQSLLSSNPEYSKGNIGEFFREEINPDEKIKQIIESEEALKQYLIPGSRTKLGEFPSGLYESYLDYNEFNKYWDKSMSAEKARDKIKTYGDGIDIAKKIEEHCQYVYSLIIEAYQGIEKGIKSPKTKETESSPKTLIKQALLQKVAQQQRIMEEQKNEIDRLNNIKEL